MKVHLLDGTYELFRSHFGAPKRKSPEGREVGAVYGLISSTLSLLDQPEVTHVAAAFDSVIESYRNEVYPGYKSSEGIDRELLDQFPIAERAMRALGVVTWSMYDYEADDAIATGAARFADDADQVVILSPDKDMAQCLDHPKVVAYDRRRRTFLDRDGVWRKFGVAPESIPDYLALVGDTADGFPGLSGWGAKSAAAVLAKFGKLEAIPLESGRWEVPVRSAATLSKTLLSHIGDALLFRFLAQLRRDVPLEEDLGDLEWRGARRDAYTQLCEELGFGRLSERPTAWVG